MFDIQTIRIFAAKLEAMITNSEIGKRISYLRELQGFSQQELSKVIGISRSSLAQIELGNRNITASELSNLSEHLNCSMDEIYSDDFWKANTEQKAENAKNDIRISVPQFDVDKFKNLILYILERCAGKPNVGETVLNKLLYFVDFNFYELYEEHLSGATYRKFKMGPVPKEIGEILKEMETDKQLFVLNSDYFGYPQRRFIPLTASDKRCFNGNEIEVIDKVINQLSDMTAAQISHYSHGDMPWKATNDRQVIDYELAFYREAPYSVRNYSEECDD